MYAAHTKERIQSIMTNSFALKAISAEGEYVKVKVVKERLKSLLSKYVILVIVMSDNSYGKA